MELASQTWHGTMRKIEAMFSLASDGKAALACLEKRLPFWGLTFTASHTAFLIACLEKEVYTRFKGCSAPSASYPLWKSALIVKSALLQVLPSLQWKSALVVKGCFLQAPSSHARLRMVIHVRPLCQGSLFRLHFCLLSLVYVQHIRSSMA